MARKEWSRFQFRRRVTLLREDGFTPEEAWDMALWSHNLDHWVLRNVRSARRKLMANWRDQGLSDDEITARLTRRYIDLGIQGLYEDEEWYVARVGA